MEFFEMVPTKVTLLEAGRFQTDSPWNRVTEIPWKLAVNGPDEPALSGIPLQPFMRITAHKMPKVQYQVGE